MEDFSKLLRIITGGIDSFEFILVSDVEKVPMFGLPEINFDDIVLKAGAVWKKGTADFNSLTLTVKPKDSAHGVIFNCAFSGVKPDVDQATGYNMATSAHVKYLVIATTKQGERILIGELEDGLQFGYDVDFRVAGARKGSKFNFSGKQRFAPQFIVKVVGVTFSINSTGYLIQNNSNTETFSIDADGKFVVSGPDEANYSINTNGQLVQV